MAATANVDLHVRLKRTWVITRTKWFWYAFGYLSPELMQRALTWTTEHVIVADVKGDGRIFSGKWQRLRMKP